MGMRDLYGVLGVPRDASAAAIRRAYKELVLRVHPDKHPSGASRDAAEALFKELSDAYQTLSDADSRSLHDAELLRSGPPPTSSVTSSSGTPTNPAASPFADPDFQRRFVDDVAKKMRAESTHPDSTIDTDNLSDALFGEHRANFQFQQERPKAPDLELPLPITLEELHSGCLKRRRLTRTVQTEKQEPGAPPRRVVTTLRIDVRPGYRPGDKIRFRDAGEETNAMRAPDIVFVIEQEEHKRFTRRGDDLHTTVAIRLGDALTGVSATVIGIESSPVTIATDTIVKPGATHVVCGAGLSRRGRIETRGDLVVTFDVQFPERLLPAERRALRDLFNKIEMKAARPVMRRSASMFAGARSASDTDKDLANARVREPRSIGRAAFCVGALPIRTAPGRPVPSTVPPSARAASNNSATGGGAGVRSAPQSTAPSPAASADRYVPPAPTSRNIFPSTTVHVFRRTTSRNRKESEVANNSHAPQEPPSRTKMRSKGWHSMFR